MAEALKVFQEEVHSLRCAICKHCLSIPPIVVIDDIGSICGRVNCRMIAFLRETSRQSIYESIAEYLKFPCKNEANGCEEILTWKDVWGHESTCQFSTMSCPFSFENYAEEEHCTWKGEIFKLLEHMELEHAENRFENNVKMNLYERIMKNKIYFTNLKDDVVLVLVRVDSKSNSHWKVSCGRKIHYVLKYRIEVSAKTGKKLISSKMLLPELINPNLFKDDVNDGWFELQCDNIMKFFESPSSFNITFYMNDIIVVEEESSRLGSTNEKLECSYCSNEVRNTLYVCRSNTPHFHCLDCREDNDVCRICPADLYLNPAFEQMELIADQFNCRCCQEVVDCLPTHFRQKHRSSMQEHSMFIKNFLNCADVYFSYENHIFFLDNNVLTNGDMYFVVQCLTTDSIKYKYNLFMRNSIHPNTSLSITNVCIPKSMDEIEDSYYTHMPVNFVSTLFPDFNNIDFKLTFVEI